MQIAIVIAGQPRFRKVFKQQLAFYTNYSHADLFLYFWENSVHENQDYMHPLPVEWRGPLTVDRVRTLMPEYLNDNISLGGIGLGDNTVVEPRSQGPCGAMFSQFQSLYQADQLRQQHPTQYDLVIRTRLDLVLTGPIDLMWIKQQIDQNPQLVFAPENCRHYCNGYGMSDHMAISSPANMAMYTDMINHLPNYLMSMPPHPEAILNYHLLKCNLNIQNVLPNGHDVVRDNQA